jgi:hypothetical protein
MQPDALMVMLKSLKLFGMAQAITDLAAQASPAYQNALPILDTLLKAEVAEREVRSVNSDAGGELPRLPGPGGL